MPARMTGGSGEAVPDPGTRALAPSLVPTDAAMRAALAVVGVLDARPEAVFDGLADLAASVCGAPFAEIRLVLRAGAARKAVGGEAVGAGLATEAESWPVVATAPIVLHLGEAHGVPVGEVLARAPHAPGAEEPAAEIPAGLLERVARQVAVELETRWSPERGVNRPTELIGVAVVDAEARLLAATPEMERMYGFTVEALHGTSMVDLLHPDDLAPALEAFTRTSRFDGTKVPYDVRVKGAGDVWVPTEFTADNRLDDPEIEGIVFVVRDQRARSRPDALVGGEARVLESVARGTPLPVVLRMLAGLVEAQDPDSVCVIMLADELGEQLHLAGHVQLPGPLVDLLTAVPIAPDGPACGVAAFRRQSVLIEDLGTSAPSPWAQALLASGLVSCWSHPVPAFDDRRVLGTVDVHRRQPGQPTNEHARLLDLCAQLVSTAVEHARAQDRLTYQATHDPLTGLPNRTLFIDELRAALDESARAADRPGSVAVVFLDLDEFKLINDSLGHRVGDVLLRQVADRLAGHIRPTDTLARFGGDEFTLLLRDVESVHEVRAIGQVLLAEVSRPYDVDGRELVVGASVGIAMAETGRSNPTGLVSDADAAMYRAKRRGRLRIEVFDEGIRTESTARLATEQDLRRAITGDQLHLVFQPEVRIEDGTTIGLEALVRWRHPVHGLVMPDGFIPIAEETGLIVPLGEWVLGEAFAVARQLPVAGLIVWANVSARQLTGSDLVAAVERLLEREGTPADAVGLEVTESALLHDAEAAVAVLRALKDLGVHLAIDDFGTGYSSLSYLKRLPIDVVKIDQSFVAGLGRGAEDAAIVEAVVGLTHSLGLRALAEGVETDEQRTILTDLGCDLAQGFLFSRPVPIDGLALAAT